MQAVRLDAVRNVNTREAEQRAPGPDEVVLRVEACGVCGTDRHMVQGEYPAILPVTLGHEFAGVVIRGGAGTESLAGSRVAVDPNISCGRCRACRRGDVALCPNRVALGVDLDGGLAEYAIVPVSQVYPLPPGVPATYGALCEPLACCLRAMDLASIAPGMSVAVLGGGIIGQLMVQLARLSGAGAVVLATRQAGRRALAERLGATATVDPRAVDTVMAIGGPGGIVPGGVDVVLECAGTVTTFEQSVALVRRGGTVVIFGVAPQEERASISPFEIFARELRILGSYLNPLTHGRAVELVASGTLALEPLITHRLSLSEVPAILLASPEAGEVKAMMVAS
jgi:L-iditol 2-dehydrogenase